MHIPSGLFLCLTYFCQRSVALCIPRGASIIWDTANNHTANRERANAVKEAFQIAWDGYQKYAFPHDELHPVSNTYGDPRNGWSSTSIDALDTAILMQLPDIVNTIVSYVPNINFGYTTTQVSLFETTIRYLGGMLAGYDLLQGPFAHLVSNVTAVDALLSQSKLLADNLKFAFNSPTGIPSNNLNLVSKTTDGSRTNSIATIGTLILEWTRLSDLTGDESYASLTQKAESFLVNPQFQPPFSQPWPGLLGTNVDIDTGLFVDAQGGWNGGDDSYYEYLIKMFVYDSSRFSKYRDSWIQAADSSIAHLASHPSSRPDLTFMAAFDGTSLQYDSSHLACFDGGNFLLGGAVLKEQKYIDFGLALVNGCHDTYASTLTGIGPESFSWSVNGSDGVPVADLAFYEKAGFYITNSVYILRPEVMESFYYAYRVTRDQKYRDWAWNAFLAINGTTRAGSGYSEISDVNAPGGGRFLDVQDSFFLAEVLKYAYLIHAPDGPWQTEYNGANQWVFNTEAHLLKVAGPPI